MPPPQKRTAGTRARTERVGEIQILRASDVELPLTAARGVATADILRIRSDFLAGKKLTREDLEQLVAGAEGGGNGNCGIC